MNSDIIAIGMPSRLHNKNQKVASEQHLHHEGNILAITECLLQYLLIAEKDLFKSKHETWNFKFGTHK